MKFKQTVYLIYAPNGRAMPSTVSMSPYGAKKKVLDIAEQKYHGLVNTNFEKWKAKGYRCCRAQINYEKESRF